MQKLPIGAQSQAQGQTGGAYIKGLRRERGLSLRELARAAGVHAGTLSRWENGRTTPKIPELEAVLSALEASAQHKQAALRQMHAPRTLQTLRALDELSAFAPFGGDLLWAMRQRKKQTQTELARAAGVTQSQIARWEKGASWPGPTVLHTLCWHLGARPDEVAALTRAEEPAGKALHDENAAPWDDKTWTDFIYSLVYYPASSPTFDLTMLVTEQRLIRLAQTDTSRQSFALARLADVYAIQARGSVFRKQEGQAKRWAERGLALARRRHFGILHTPDATPASSYWFGSILAVASAGGQSKQPATVRYAAHLLHEWLPTLDPTDAHYQWGQMELATLLTKMRRFDEAVSLGKAVCETSEARFSPTSEVRWSSDSAYRWRDYAHLLLEAGRPAQAAHALSRSANCWPVDEMTADAAARHHLLNAECFVALKDATGASDHLSAATRLVAGHDLQHLQADLFRVAVAAEKRH